MDDVFLRQMPHSVEAEQAVLGSMLIDSRCVADVIGALRREDFYVDANRDIFDTISGMFNFSMVIDPVTVLDQMKVDGVYKESTPNYLMQLMDITPTAANVMEYCSIVQGKSLLRSIADTGDEISAMAYAAAGEPEDILEDAEKKIYSIRSDTGSSELEPVSKILVSVYEQIAEAARNGSAIPGTPTGFPDLDKVIMGLNRSDLIIIASRPGMGKTSLALPLAVSAAKHSGKTVAFFSLEMSKEQLCIRLLSGESFVDNRKLQTGNLTQEDWSKIAAASASIGSLDIRINDNPTLTVSDMSAQCRRIRDLGLVVIDYLQLMQASGSGTSYSNENRQQVVSDISRMLKIMAKELNVPVICLAQLSRANEGRSDKRPMLSDLRESGAIEQDADIVIGLYRDDYYNPESEDANIAELIILKNRRGETGKVKLGWLGEYTTFSSLESRYSE